MQSIKKGFVYSSKDATAASKIRSVNPAWYYNWGMNPISGLDNIPFVDMAWSGKANLSSISEGCDLLCLNEPDRTDQANMSVDDAVKLWPQIVATNCRIGSPATASNALKAGGWFEQFMQQSPKVDFIAIHWYAAPKPSSLLSLIDGLYEKYQLPIWITEFAVADWTTANKYTPEQVVTFMKTIIPELERRSYVERYSWKTRSLDDPNMGSSSLFDASGNLTPLGEIYKSF